MTLPQNEMCLADAVEDWWDTNIEKVKKKLGRERWVNEFEDAIHSNSDYLQKAVSNALATKKYDWSTYDIINQNTQDDIAEVLANLAYQDLYNDDEWRDTRFDSFEKYHNGKCNMHRSKLEARITKIEKSLKNERFEDLHNGVVVRDIDGKIGMIKARDSISELRMDYGHQLRRVDLRRVNDWCKRVGSHDDIGVVIKYNDGRWDIVCGPDGLSSLRIVDGGRKSSLEESLHVKNENFDISADVYNWFNDYCNSVLDKDKKYGWKILQEDLESTDVSVYADECLIDLAVKYELSQDDMEDYRDQVEYDLEKLVKDALEHMEYSIADLSFDRNHADWLDRYADNARYTASLESRIRKLESKLYNKKQR